MSKFRPALLWLCIWLGEVMSTSDREPKCPKSDQRFCPDDCPNLKHSVYYGGECSVVGEKLKDYDIDASLVKYRRHENCPLSPAPKKCKHDYNGVYWLDDKGNRIELKRDFDECPLCKTSEKKTLQVGEKINPNDHKPYCRILDNSSMTRYCDCKTVEPKNEFECFHDRGAYWIDCDDKACDDYDKKQFPVCPFCNSTPKDEGVKGIQWYINHIEDYLGGNVCGQERVDYMGLTVFLRQTLMEFSADHEAAISKCENKYIDQIVRQQEEMMRLESALKAKEEELQAHKDGTLDGDCQVCDYDSFQRLIKDKDARIAELEKQLKLEYLAEHHTETVKSLESQLKSARDNALEEAAKESDYFKDNSKTAVFISANIRSLKTKGQV